MFSTKNFLNTFEYFSEVSYNVNQICFDFFSKVFNNKYFLQKKLNIRKKILQIISSYFKTTIRNLFSKINNEFNINFTKSVEFHQITKSIINAVFCIYD